MRKILFDFRGRVRNLDFSSWKRRLESKRFLRYYISSPKDDKRNPVAKWLDFYGGLLMVWLLALLFLLSILPSTTLALGSSIILLAIEIRAARSLREKKISHMKYHRSQYLAGKRCLKDIEALTTRLELSSFLAVLLSERPNFKDVSLNKEEKSNGLNDRVAITACYRDKPIAIQCCPKSSGPISTDQVNMFINAMEEHGFRRGILATSGEFSPEARQMIAVLRDRYRIHLIEGLQLVEMARQARHKIYPTDIMENDLKETPDIKTKPNRREVLKHSAVGTKRQGSRYLVSAAFLLSLYMLFPSTTYINVIYLFFIGINIILALLCFISGKSHKLLEPIEEM